MDAILGDYLNGERGMGGVYNPFNLGLYTFTHLNPLRFLDPDGNESFEEVSANLDQGLVRSRGVDGKVQWTQPIPGYESPMMGGEAAAMALGAAEGAIAIRALVKWGAKKLAARNAPETMNQAPEMEALTTLYRAVGPDELADIQSTGKLVNRGSAEGKYFTTSSEHASDYARQAVSAFGDAPYTTIRTQVPTSSLPSPVSVDGGIPAYVIPNEGLPGLSPEILNSMAIPRAR